jgi:NAD(P)-dependent dehydrogenase (short-subunit alcohol dehydrogenase family)
VDRFSLQGRRAVVTGASRGIGAGIATALDQAEARVALLARDREALETVAAGLGHDPVVIPADLADPDSPAAAAGAALDALGAVDAFTRSLAMELGPSGIRVNSVAPGVVDTDLWARNKAIPGVVEQIEAQTPLRRWSTPDDIAGVVVFLASDAARFVTGETICADGGMARCLDLYGGPV